MLGYYDDNMVRNFGGKSGAEERFRAALAHAQALYQLPSLNTTIKINLLNLTYVNGSTWFADGPGLG